MKLAFCIFKYFPYGGLQRDFMRIAQEALTCGHDVDVYTTSWEGAKPNAMNVHLLPVQGRSNHRRILNFAKKTQSLIIDKQYDAVIGFNKIPGLDFYFAGDVCFKDRFEREKHFLHRFLPRYRSYLALEEKVFSIHAKTQVLFLTPQQKIAYIKAYQTPMERFHLLPAGIARNLMQESLQYNIRQIIRQSFLDDKDQMLILFVASDFYNKGLDRALKALSVLPKDTAKLLVIGGDDSKPYMNLIHKLDLTNRVLFLGKQDNLIHYMSAADILLHPARVEAAGMVLLEAMTAGLPIITTDICGYASHVKQSGAGLIVPTPFQQATLDELLLDMVNADRDRYRQKALCYADRTDLYSMAKQAIKRIEAYYDAMV